jgi:peptidoglycan hydrolase-like protein with peptidoglycan-binding domain
MTIKQRQHLLAYLGYYVGNVDGDWGTLSKTACTAFQKDFGGIGVDGYGGKETDKALCHAVAYGMMKTENVPDNNDGKNTGTFWDDIKYWSREEFRCQCGGKYCNGFPAEPDETLVRLLDDVREHFDRPGHRSSGLRCKTWNAIQGGVATSKHQYGKAMDFRIEGYTAPQVLDYVLEHIATAYAYDIDGTYVHVDVD